MLAGGRSSRFGRDKLTQPYRGRPLFHHPILALAEVSSEVIVVVSPDADVKDLPPGPVRVARDPNPFQGPLAGLAAGLWSVETRWAVVAGGDMPELRPSLLPAMLRIADAEHKEAVALMDGETMRPLPCVLRASGRDVARRLRKRGKDSLLSLLEALDVRGVPEFEWRTMDPKGEWRKDVDVPQDIEG